MEWYLPITILPAIGILIMSTTAQMMNLSGEIGNLLSGKCSAFELEISEMKINQLGRLTRSVTLLYVSAASFTLSGLISGMVEHKNAVSWSEYILIFGVAMVLIALSILIFYGYRTIKIRRVQHTHNGKR